MYAAPDITPEPPLKGMYLYPGRVIGKPADRLCWAG